MFETLYLFQSNVSTAVVILHFRLMLDIRRGLPEWDEVKNDRSCDKKCDKHPRKKRNSKLQQSPNAFDG